jgi:hypothetical protein
LVGKIDVGTLSKRVNAGVGPSGSVNANVFAAHPLQSALKMVLNGIAMGLALPTREWSAIVSDD